jgi:hypothetical protein
VNLLSNNYIWLLPWRTASRETYNTIIHNNITVTPFQPDTPKKFSHVVEIQKGYENYPVIINTRNPYSRIVSSWKLNQVVNLKTLSSYPNNVDTIKVLCAPESYTGKDFELNTPVYQTFKSWIEQGYGIDKKAPDVEYAHVIKFENYEHDILSVPFIKSLPPTLKNSHDQGFMISYISAHIITSINASTFSKDYYINFIDNYNLTNRAVIKNYELWGNLKQALLNYTEKQISRVKQIFFLPNAKNIILADINVFFNPDWKLLYNQEIADRVYKDMESWFIKFNYAKDSWKI